MDAKHIYRVTAGEYEALVQQMENEGCYGADTSDALHEYYDDERAALLRALDWAGDDMVEAERLETAALWDRLEALIERTGEVIQVMEFPLLVERHEVVRD